jgi:hypothetical protein
MRLLTCVGAAVAALAVTATAQDTTTKSRTKIQADDAQVISLTGCLRQDAAGAYALVGGIAAAGDELSTKSKVKSEVDDDEVTVKGKTQTKAEDGAVATTGTMSTYALIPRNDVNLRAHVGHQVQVSAVVVEAGKGDADVKITDKTKVDPDNGSDTTSRTKTKVELPKSPLGSYSVVSVTPLSGTCSAQ